MILGKTSGPVRNTTWLKRASSPRLLSLFEYSASEGNTYLVALTVSGWFSFPYALD